MARNQYSKKREKLIDSADERLSSILKRYQSRLVNLITDQINDLDRDGDTLKDSIGNISKIAQLNKMYRDFIAEHGLKIVDPIVQDLEKIHNANIDYFESITGKDVKKMSDKVQMNTFKSFGFNITTGKVIVGGLLHAVLFDESPVNKLKSFLINALKGSTTAKNIINRFKEVGKGTRTPNGIGIFEKHIYERIPEPFQRFDRATGTIIATDLKLNYAIYQGGLVRDSRPFCVERNNKVFSRDEISKFGTSADKYGGYTNKSNGEFQGKGSGLYDPFTDLGSINCRHSLDWVSDELAFVLRPDLKP